MRGIPSAIIPGVGQVNKTLPNATPNSTVAGANFQYDLAGGKPVDVHLNTTYRVVTTNPSSYGSSSSVTNQFNLHGNILSLMACSDNVAGMIFVALDDPTADRIPLRVGTVITGIEFNTLYFFASGVYDIKNYYLFVAYDNDQK